MRLLDYNFLHHTYHTDTDTDTDTDTGTGTDTGTSMGTGIHNRTRIRTHNTYLPKNDDRGDKILVAYFCIYLTLLTKIITIFTLKVYSHFYKVTIVNFCIWCVTKNTLVITSFNCKLQI
jgi:hypothetical protein